MIKPYVFYGLLDRTSLVGVEGQHLLDQVNAVGSCLVEELTKVFALFDGEVLHKLLSLWVDNLLLNELGFNASKVIVNHPQLFRFTSSSHQGLAANHFGQNATYRPDVGLTVVNRLIEHNLRRPVPPSSHVISNLGSLGEQVGNVSSGETIVAYFKITSGINQQVCGFQVSMNDASRVHIFKASENLVGKEL